MNADARWRILRGWLLARRALFHHDRNDATVRPDFREKWNERCHEDDMILAEMSKLSRRRKRQKPTETETP